MMRCLFIIHLQILPKVRFAVAVRENSRKTGYLPASATLFGFNKENPMADDISFSMALRNFGPFTKNIKFESILSLVFLKVICYKIT